MALPSGTTGSLRPTFVPARPIGLAVKHPYTFTLDARLPTGLRVPLHSSVLRVTPIRVDSLARIFSALSRKVGWLSGARQFFRPLDVPLQHGLYHHLVSCCQERETFG